MPLIKIKMNLAEAYLLKKDISNAVKMLNVTKNVVIYFSYYYFY